MKDSMKILGSIPGFSVQLSQVPNPLPCALGTPTTSPPPAPASIELSPYHSLVVDWYEAKTQAVVGHFTNVSVLVCI